ncbi:MAG: ABC transporter permease subunit [Pirellulales bacterium]|nr:ABC transporter permease subunit [Pirellulales bacterium]
MSQIAAMPRWLWLLLTGVLAALPLLGLDRIGWQLATNSLLLVGGVVAIAVPLGTFLAVALFRFDIPFRRLWIALSVLQIFIPLYVYGAAWRSTLGLTGWAHDSSLGRIPWLMLDGWSGAIWTHAAASVPWVVLILGIALRYVEPELEEDALTAGSFGQVLQRVTFRRVGLAAAVSTLWIAVVTATEITATDLFQVRTFAEELYTAISLTNPSLISADYATIANTTIAAWLALLLMVVLKGLAAHTKAPPTRQAVLFPLVGAKRFVAGIVTALVMLIMVGVPLGTMVRNAGIIFDVGPHGLPQQSWSATDAAQTIASSPVTYHEEFSWAVQTAVAAATCVLIVATLACWVGRHGGWKALPALSLTSISLALPGPLIAMCLIRLWSQSESAMFIFLYDRTIVPPMLGQMIKALPAAILILWMSLHSVPQETLESASSAGAGGWTRWWRIALPQRVVAVAAAWLAAFAIAIGEVPASILLQPPGISLMSPHIFTLLHGENVHEIAGIILAMWGIAALAGGVIVLWWRKVAATPH